MLFVTILYLIAIEFFAWYRYRDILCPAVLHNIFWILSLAGLGLIDAAMDISIKTSFVIISGGVAFQIGYAKSPIPPRRSLKSKIRVNIQTLYIFIFLLFIPFLWVMWLYIKSGVFSGATLYNALTEGKEEVGLPTIVSYVFKFIQFFSLAVLTINWTILKNSKNRLLKRAIFLLFVMALVCTLSVPTRNGLLFYFAPLIMVYLFTHKLKRKQILAYLAIGLLVFLAFFYFVSVGKYWYNYENGESPLSVLSGELLSYLSLSIHALDITMDSHEFTRLGSDTFRFLLAIWDSIAGTNYTPNIVNDFIETGPTTNVYTFYDYYLRDFGVFYAILIQFLVAWIHGYFYKRLKVKKGLSTVYFCALLVYPLLMQFFQDQYASLMSLWVQALVVELLVFGTDIFLTYEKPVTSGCKVLACRRVRYIISFASLRPRV